MMENPDPSAAVSGFIGRTRRLTKAIQIIPFLYLLLFSVFSLAESVIPDDALGVINELLYVAPGAQAALILLSRLMRLCRWHRIACLLPATSQIEGYIDGYVFQFTQVEIAVINTIIGIISFTFILLSFHHFFHGRKNPDPADA